MAGILDISPRFVRTTQKQSSMGHNVKHHVNNITLCPCRVAQARKGELIPEA